MAVWAVLLFVALLTIKQSHAFSRAPIRPPQRYHFRVGAIWSSRTPSLPATQPLQNKTKKRPWTYSPLSPARRQQVLSIINELEEENDVNDVESSLDVISQWARLGEGERATSACDALLMIHSSLDDPTKNKAYRRVLHAWCNQLKRVTSSDTRRQRRRQSRPAPFDKHNKQLANRAEQVLMKMKKAEPGDYQAVIQAHASCLQVSKALYLLKQWNEPTAAAYASVIRCILSPQCKVDIMYERHNERITPVAMAHELLVKCHESTSPENRLSTQVYNRVLNAWSMSLPHFDKKNVNSGKGYTDVMTKVEWIWEAIEQPDIQTFTLMIYSYCKLGRGDQAYEVWRQLLERLLSDKANKNERVDARSFRMLVKALSAGVDEKHCEYIDSILNGMWRLHELGYDDTAPDVFLYTTAMNAWASHGKVDRVRSLLKDLETHHQQLQWKSLQADTAVYNALIHVIKNQENAVNAAEEAGSVVKLMERSGVEPDTVTYNTLIDACLASNSERGRERADQTLLWMVEAFKKGNARVKPTLKTFSSVINAWTAANSPAKAEALLDVMEERYRPPALLFDAVITSWCNHVQMGDSNAAKRAMRLLLRMEELFEATGNEALQPTMSLYNQVIQVLNDVGNGDDAFSVFEHRDRVYPPVDATLEPRQLTSSAEVFGLLQYLENAPTISPQTPATVKNFNFVISQLGKSEKIWAGQRAEDVLNFMLENKKKIAPNTATFNSVMAAYAKSGHRNAGEKAAAVLEKMMSLSDAEILEGVKADRISYNTLMNAYAKSSDPMPGSLAEAVFDELETLYEVTQDETLKPDIVSYSTLLNALAKGGDQYSANRAEDILLQMLKRYEDDPTNVKPNTLCFNEVIYAWAKSPDDDASKRAEMVLKLMEDMYAAGNIDVKPDTRTYNVVLYALACSKEEDAPIRASLLLDRMKSEYCGGNDAVKPDAVSYSTVISAWARQGGLASVNATITLLEDLYESDIKVQSSFFSNLIHSLTRTKAEEAPTAAEIIILDLIKRVNAGELDVKINTEIYNALIHCWGKSGNRGAAARAEEILQEMEDEYAEGSSHVQPNVQTYTSVVDAYAKSREPDAAKKAEAILNRMEDDGMVRPNAHTYTAVIQAYARSDLASKAKHAQSILHRMKDDYKNGNEDARPSVVTYNTVLNACEFSAGEESGMEEAFRVACETLDEVRSCEYVAPDDITYGTFLGVIAKLMPKSDTTNDLIELVFKRCCADGQLGPVTLKKLSGAASVSRYRRLLGGTEENIPPEWTCNVQHR